MPTSKQKLLKKLSTQLANRKAHTVDEQGPKQVAERLEVVLEDHLDTIAAAHQSNHGSVHQSLPVA